MAATSNYRIDSVAAGAGRIGLGHCPGRNDAEPRSVAADLNAIVAWGARALLTLVEPHELTLIGAQRLPDLARELPLEWWHLPIEDMCAPDLAFEARWPTVSTAVHALLEEGSAVMVHCRGGFGRAGTIAARLLIERGMEPLEAIAAVRKARPGAIETVAQECFLSTLAPTS